MSTKNLHAPLGIPIPLTYAAMIHSTSSDTSNEKIFGTRQAVTVHQRQRVIVATTPQRHTTPPQRPPVRTIRPRIMSASILAFAPHNAPTTPHVATAQHDATVLAFRMPPSRSQSLTKRDVATLRALMTKLTGDCVCDAWTDADGDVAAVIEWGAEHPVYRQTLTVTRNGSQLRLIDGHGDWDAFDSLEALTDAIGDAGLATGATGCPSLTAQRPSQRPYRQHTITFWQSIRPIVPSPGNPRAFVSPVRQPKRPRPTRLSETTRRAPWVTLRAA